MNKIIYLYPYLDWDADRMQSWKWMDASEWGSLLLVVVGWWQGAEERWVFTDVVILFCDRLDHSITQRWLDSDKNHTRVAQFWGGGVSWAKSDQQMELSCATAICDDDDIVWKWTTWLRQPRGTLRNTKKEKDRTRPEERTSFEEPLLESKAAIKRKKIMLIHFYKHRLYKTLFPRLKCQKCIWI